MSANKSKVQFDTDHEASSRMSMPRAQAATKRHPEFYFDDSLVVIQVEDTLFKVHKYQLIKSETFSDMFKMPNGPTKNSEEGASPEYPIVLDGVKASDFVALLKVLYTVHYTNERPKPEPEIIVPAFRLAHMWNFADLRTHLLPLAKDTLDCVDKIVLARELGIREWLAPAHVELCQRTESLTVAEVEKLGVHSTVMIMRLREKFRPSQSVPSSGGVWCYCSSCGGNAPMFSNHGDVDCHRCGSHIWSGTSCHRFPVTPSSASPHSGSAQNYWVYCHSCGHVPSTWGRHGAANCHKCGTHLGSNTAYYRFTATPDPSSAAPSDSDEALASQLKSWVEGGCMTE